MAVEPDDLETAASANILTDESLIVNPLTLINGRIATRKSTDKSLHCVIACSSFPIDA